MFNPLSSSAARLVTVVLVLQAALLYSSMRPETAPLGRPLAQFPTSFGNWQMIQEGVIAEESRQILKADDLMTRDYGSAGAAHVNLYVAAFQSQRNGKTLHSPKNCLPGNGYSKLSEGTMSIDVGLSSPIEVNRYLVGRGGSRSLVMYWYQSRDRIVASEYAAKFWVIVDSMRLNRTDSALVRVVVPVNGEDDASAERTATDFIRAFFPSLRQFLPA